MKLSKRITLSVLLSLLAALLVTGGILFCTAEGEWLLRILPPLVLGFAVSGILLPPLLRSFVMRPLRRLDPEHPENGPADRELLPYTERISKQNRIIREQLQMLETRKQAALAVSEHLREGFLLVDTEGALTGYNAPALKLLEPATAETSQQPAEALRPLLEKALQGSHTEQSIALGGRWYRLCADPVRDGERITGGVLVALDVTEQESRETLRREFTANVSHELKTPLTSILGYADMLRAGMVQPQDVPDFLDRICRESSRMIALIQDILKLSRLDEKSLPMHRETVDLRALAENVLSRLESQAAARQIRLIAEGDAVIIEGVRQLLDELLYNLCDNAIKYNADGGTVRVYVRIKENCPLLSVSDTGIGIPPESQARVFERFYRVDKSHSRKIGGTGLGLSIVKHAAALHGATVTLESQVGRGSTFTVRFPAV